MNEPKKEWEKDFDSREEELRFWFLKDADKVKSFIQNLLTSRDEALAIEVEKVFDGEMTHGRVVFGDKNAWGCAKEKILALIRSSREG